MDVVPGCLPVAKALDVLDRNVGLRRVAEDRGEQVVLALHLGRLVAGIVEHLAVHVAEDVVAYPAHHLEVAGGKHRSEHAFEQRFARFPIAAGMRHATVEGQLLQGRRRAAG